MSRVRDESGVALVIVLIVLVIAGLLAAAVIAGAVQSNDTTIRGGNLNAAVAAADSGLDVAAYRINMLAPASGNCVTTAVVAPTNGKCPQDGPESLGNGARYTFWTSPVMAAGGTCAGLQVDSSQSAIAQRCITAVGTANGVSARVQARVAAFTATPLFPEPLVGLAGVTIGNNATIGSTTAPAVVGTNGQPCTPPLPCGLTVGGGNTVMTGYVLGPIAPAPQVGNGATTGTGTTRTAAQGPFVLSPVNPGNSATVNDDSRITSGSDPLTGNKNKWNPATRSLEIGNNGSLTLGGATYNFCNFQMDNNSTLTVASNTKIRMFIDSPDDPNSGCPTGSGNFTMSNNGAAINNYGGNYQPGTGDPTALQIYVYGLNNHTNTVAFSNNTNSYVTLYAPQSNVVVSPSNNTSFTGAIAGYTVSIGNATNFQYSGQDSGLTAGTTGLYYRTAWEQCPATPTSPSDPTSGC
jgi:Tfp pilus assembly protein PilX